jgi:hypothetical protein
LCYNSSSALEKNVFYDNIKQFISRLDILSLTIILMMMSITTIMQADFCSVEQKKHEKDALFVLHLLTRSPSSSIAIISQAELVT